MARVSINPIEIKNHSEFKDAGAYADLLKAIDATDGAEIKLDGHDERCVLLVHNSASSASNVTVKAGNGLQGVSDLVYSIPASNMALIVLESGKFKNVSGDYKGKAIIKGAASLKVAFIKLP